MEPLSAAFTAYISQYFIIALIWMVAAILSLSRWQKHPKVSRLTVTAIVIFFAESLARVYVNFYLPFMLRDAGRDYIPPFFYGLTGLILSVIQAVAWSFLIVAIFSQRDKM